MNASQDLTSAVTALEGKVARALETGDVSDLEILGYGEISVVVALETDDGHFACKRLPRFADEAALESYTELLDDYLDALRSAGVDPVSSEIIAVDQEDGVIAYCVQPAFDPSCLATNILHEPESIPLLAEIIDTAVRTIGPRMGLDAQVSNWAHVDGRLVYLDVTTPLMQNDDGSERLDTGIFLASLPWALRGVVRRFLLTEILSHYYDARAAVLDLVGNLVKERLDTHLPSAVALANAHVDPPITEHEARAYYRSDARTWGLLQRIRRVDRGWQTNVRGRVYPFLLPGRIER